MPLKCIAVEKGLIGGPFGSSLVSRDYARSGVPVIRGANMSHGRFVSGDFVYVSQEKFEADLSRNSAQGGDLIYTQRGTLGQVALLPPGKELHVISQSQMRLRIDEAKADPLYVYYASTSPHFLWQIDNRAISTGVPHINLGILGDLEIPLPSIAEQRAIAATLGALDDKIESNRRAVTIAEQLGDALFAAAASESRLLSDVADITMGSSPKGADLNEDGDGLPFYQGTRDFGVRFPSLRVWTTAPVRTAAKSDTLMSVRAPVGELNRASADCCIGRGVAAIHSDTHPSTLYYAMRSSSSAWEKFQGEGTVFASVNKTDVHGAEIRWVGDGALLELEDKLRAIDARIESLESETQRLTALRDALLPELLSGRMRVPAEGVAA